MAAAGLSRLKWYLTMLAGVVALPAQAATSQLSITQWQQRYSADVFVDAGIIKADADFKIESNPGYQLSYSYTPQHAYWPTLGASYTHSDTRGLGNVIIKLFGIPFGERTLYGTLDLSHLDLSAHYSWATPWLSFHGGIIARRFDAGVFLGTISGQNADLPIDDTIPIFQGGLSHEWHTQHPAGQQHHFGFKANYAYIRYNLDKIIDRDAKLYWQFPSGISIAAGYRDMDIDYSVPKGLMEARTRGATLSLGYHW